MYKILMSSTPLGLEKEVAFYMRKNWVPQGGVIYTGAYWYQAVVLS